MITIAKYVLLFACCLIWLVVVGHVFAPPAGRMLGDSTEYLHFAANLLDGKGFSYDPAYLNLETDANRLHWFMEHRGRGLFAATEDVTLRAQDTDSAELRPTNMRQPLYPLFLYSIFKCFGFRPLAVFLVQAVLFLASLVLTLRLAQLLFPQVRHVGLVTVGAMLFFVPLGTSVSLVMSEILLMFLLCSSLYVLLTANRIWQLVFGGCLLGLASLTKLTALPFALAAIALMPSTLQKRFWILAALLLPLGCWSVRNGIAVGQFSPLTGEGGINLWWGTYDPVNPFAVSFRPCPQDEFDRIAGSDYYMNSESSRRFSRAAVDRMMAKPLQTMQRNFARVLRAGILDFPCGRSMLGTKFPLVYRILQILMAALWLAFFVSIARFRRATPAVRLLLAVPICLFGLTFFSWLSSRNGLPFYPLLFMGASATVLCTLSRLRTHSQPNIIPSQVAEPSSFVTPGA